MIPEVGAALAAAGALLSDLTAQYPRDAPPARANLRFRRRQRGVGALEDALLAPRQGAPASRRGHDRLGVEARYPEQVWEIEVPLRAARFDRTPTVDALVHDFHAMHRKSSPWRTRNRRSRSSAGAGRAAGRSTLARWPGLPTGA